MNVMLRDITLITFTFMFNKYIRLDCIKKINHRVLCETSDTCAN